MDTDRNTPNQAANKSKAEGERWSSDPNTVEQQDRVMDTETEREGGGITNRPLDEERQNQAAVPERGTSRDGAHAGHGDREPRGDER